ncbi:DUF6474 family protein [Nocardia stercoris]|uniref:Uncharacterized protein n=1 Tax=Nocardia stercoris TaxID=2483361 RepID=A0A3M2LA41_9NOCA|nr:DUF6474 family protein [Nocardia stercoris]RMI34437.1 hypothetical protein EBN03_06985 [Nocardia stercoris]
MGLFTKRKTRSDRKAEAKALKHKAGLEAKLSARNERKRNRAELRTQREVAKAQIATLKAEEKAAVKTAERADRELLSAGQIKKYLGVARVLVPVLAPLVYQGATLLRGQIDTRRAQRLGIGIEQLSEFSGPGAKLQARIANAENSLTQIDSRGGGQHTDTAKFAAATRERLDNLSTAIRAAEQMPAQRRRAVYASISTELGGIEADLLSRLGVR